jgi:hypothetical protein
MTFTYPLSMYPLAGLAKRFFMSVVLIYIFRFRNTLNIIILLDVFVSVNEFLDCLCINVSY